MIERPTAKSAPIGRTLRSLLARARAAAGLPADGRSVGAGADPAGPLLDESALRQLSRLRIDNGQSLTDWLIGEHRGLQQRPSQEFEDYRPYVPGDDFRLIDWQAYARLGDLYIKTAASEERISLSLLVDCSRSMAWGTPTKLRYAKQIAAVLGALALLHGDRVRVYGLGDGTVAPGASLYGAGALPDLTSELDGLPPLHNTSLAESIAAYEQIGPPRGVIVLLSDLLVPMDQVNAVPILMHTGRSVFVVQVYAPSEAAPTLQGTFSMQDAESGAVQVLAINPTVRAQYAQRFRDRLAAVRNLLAPADLRYTAASTAVSPVDLVANGLQAEGLITQI